MLQLNSARLYLKQYEANDAAEVLTFLSANAVHLKNVLPTAAKAVSKMEDAKGLVRMWQAGWLMKNYFAIGIWLHDVNKLVGQIDLFNVDRENGSMEIGYYVHREYQQKGIASEAVSTLTQYILNNWQISRLTATTHPNNAASISILDRCGFFRTNTTKERIYFSLTNDMQHE